MGQDLWTAVDQYIADLMVPVDPALEKAIETSHLEGLPLINVSANQGKLLYLLACIQGANSILEIGTLGGYSTIWLARALKPTGHLITLELDPHHVEVARTNLEGAGLLELVEIRTGPAVKSLSQLEAEKPEPFDMVFIDADKQSYPEYFKSALRLTRPGSIIVIDNVVRNGAVIDENSTDTAVQGTRQLNELISREKNVSAVEIQTVGSKGYDGFALIRVL